MDNQNPLFSKISNQIGPYDTDTDPHRPILFPVWPTSQKELPTPVLDTIYDSYSRV